MTITMTKSAARRLEELRTKLLGLHTWYDTRLDDENADRQYLLEDLLRRLLVVIDGATSDTVRTYNERITDLRNEQTRLIGDTTHLLANGHVISATNGTLVRLHTIRTEARTIAKQLRELGALVDAADAADGWAILPPLIEEVTR